MPRHEAPPIMKDWIRVCNNPPRCCHSCGHYRESGVCEKFNMEPPEDFAATVDACADHIPMVPF
jgi:hypothetical protein